ncbi:hypothetical protein [Actinoplanes sp. CA-252034]|uniref:VHL beta domain-containing protein n=1 Tax=Actinoplanes sp. CA-252034 TaxID=3239906 RepID=UPI003D96ACDD
MTLLRSATEPGEWHGDSIDAGAPVPGQPAPDTLSPAARSSSGAAGSRPPSRASSAPSHRTGPSPTAAGGPTTTGAPAGVTALSPLRERYLRSLKAEQWTEIGFVNNRDEPVVIHWLDYHGTRERYDVLASGDTRQQPTYVSHPWVVTDVRGRSLAIFLPANQPAQATIT